MIQNMGGHIVRKIESDKLWDVCAEKRVNPLEDKKLKNAQ